MSGGAIPAKACKQGVGVVFIQPVIIRHVSLRDVSTFCAWHDLLQVEHAYSAIE